MPTSSEHPSAPRRWLRYLTRAALAVVALLFLAVLGFFGWVHYQGTHPWRGPASYVALGSSFAAGPGLFPRETRSPLLCAQSVLNYPHQVARDLGLDLVDRTCSGATTRHILEGGQFFQPPQIDAVGPETRLVTVTIGGNDFNFGGTLMTQRCSDPSLLVLLLVSCKPWPEQKVRAGLAQASTNLRRIATEVHRRAPKARLIFVNYFRVVPDSGTCPGLGFDDATADRVRRLAATLHRITREAAAAGNASFVDLAALGQGHDACSTTPWINGAHPGGRLPAPFHPNLAGMTAAARAIEAVLRGPPA